MPGVVKGDKHLRDCFTTWLCSSADRAARFYRDGRGFDSSRGHYITTDALYTDSVYSASRMMDRPGWC